ncbi:pirin family protein [Chitinophaga sp. Cy-1792]|uniref:pirin family protein n=1 Tax=Chitinophaga sp. Cy-1792 TaxID=2608339 RepID=UPI001421952C|nr:pirin family protein [Chitinophaga sp. Cy-1792]NIG54685.1 pirin family protein [Chitinophaga sp. Cy-1792]
MKKQVINIKQGHRADVGEYKIYRVLPDHEVRAVGPFVFLDYVPPVFHAADEPRKFVNGSGAHPHRGIATLTYVLNGEADHFDSNGHHAKVYSGGAQWMKAGTGIIHDEAMNPDPNTNDGLTHGFQFWVNLPAKNKAEQPDYRPVQAAEMPKIALADNAGWLKVVAGEYLQQTSPIPAYSEQFIYHIQLEAGKSFSLNALEGREYALFLPVSGAVINDVAYREQQLLVFDTAAGEIDIQNVTDSLLTAIVFGGAPYTEPIVAQGPFVMNTQKEIATAYNDFYEGKYGHIKYEQQAQ